VAIQPKINDAVKIRGIRRRWLVNSMSIILLILFLTFGTLTLMIWSYYYGTMSKNLLSVASTTASSFNQYTQNEYRTTAQTTVSSSTFQYSAQMEIQFVETDGTVLYTNYGEVTSGTVPGTPDVTEALEIRTATVWIGRDPNTNERIMAASAPVIYRGQTVVGVIRLVTSMREVDKQMAFSIAWFALFCAAILSLVYFSNLYFVRSIVEPVAAITENARLIADGSFGIQIEKQYDDEIGELIDTINDMSMKIKRSEKTQSEFISSVSHELRTPLTAITGWAETMQSGELKNPMDMQKGLDIIVSEARRLTNMVEELLEFSRIEDGRFTLSVEPMDLKAELEDAVYTYREFFRREGIELTYHDEWEDSIPVIGDPERLRQVFCNLLDNAAKHGGSGKQIDVSIHCEAEQAVIRIRDYGPGVPEEELPHIKYKFYKGSSKTRGSGIGLAVCEEIITRHEGTLEIGNADGGGCIVTIRVQIRT